MPQINRFCRISLAVLATAVALAAGGRALAQSPEPTPTATAEVSVTATPDPATTATPVPANPVETPAGSMRITFSIRAGVTEGRQQEIPHGSLLVLRGTGGGICAQVALDAAAINAGRTISGQDLTVIGSRECGEPRDPLSVEILFPPGSDIGGVLLYLIAWEPGTSLTLELVIPPPIPIPFSGGTELPATGQGSGGSTGVILTWTGLLLLTLGGLGLASATIGHSAGRRR